VKVEVRKSEVEGRVATPPSKSYTHRALVCAALARGTSRITSPLRSEDTEATYAILAELGVPLSRGPGLWEVEGGELRRPGPELFCGESATTLRFLTAVCALVNGECRLTCGPSLARRPVAPLLDGLRQLGVDCRSAGGFPPVVVRGGGIRGGEAAIPGDVSSQFVSALLLVSPLADGPVSLRLTAPLESRPYVSMTLEAQRRFGVEVHASNDMSAFHVEGQSYRPAEFTVEGDWSSAAYLLSAGALAGRVTVEGLNPQSLQADASIITVLREMGARPTLRGGTVSVDRSSLGCVEFDVSDCPDLFPVAASLCAAAEGRSVLRGVRRLKYKESDRVAAMVEGLRRMGIEASPRGDGVAIDGGAPRGRTVDPRRDHRIAMAFGVLGLAAEGATTILDAGCVSKSYPGFWDAMERLGAGLRRFDDGE